MRRGIQENNKSYVFYRMISKNPIEVSLQLGWVWIKETVHSPSWCNPFRKVTNTETYTIEDARNLIAAITELIPKEETEKSQS